MVLSTKNSKVQHFYTIMKKFKKKMKSLVKLRINK